MPQCRNCKKSKDEEEFPWRNSKRGIRATICKTCMARQTRKWYAEHREEHKRTVRARREEARRKAIDFVFDYLSYHVCEVCGEYRPEMLQFDHVRGKKKKAISQMAQEGYSIDAIKREILKCRVICANCHQMAEKRRREN